MGGKSRTQARADLRLDLKDSGALWSDAELDRCIERAVADLSRFLPREKVYEESLQFAVTAETVTMPKAADGSGIVNTESLSGVVAGETCTIDGQPDVPRTFRWNVQDADDSITGLTVIVTGTDEDESAITEAIHYIAGDTKNGVGKKYFKNVYSVEIDQIAGNGAGDVFELGWGAYTDVWVSLAHKPVKWGSETSVTDVDDNAIVRNTDFYIDYINGRIKAISGGDIVAGDTVTISYTKGQVWLDLSSLADLIRVDRVEYPVGDVPQSFVPTETWGKILIINGGPEQAGQTRMSEDKQVRVYYFAEHHPPADYSPATYPEFLENTVLLASSAYALFIEALQYEHAAVNSLSSIAAIHTLAATALNTVIDFVDEAHTQAGTATTFLNNNVNEDSKYWLTKITTDIAGLRTDFLTAVDAMATALGLVCTNSLDKATTGAEGYLDTYDGNINTVNLGADVAAQGANYARARAEIAVARIQQAMAYGREAELRLDDLRTYIEQAAGWGRVADGFFADTRLRLEMAHARISLAGQYLAQIDRYQTSANANLIIADKFKEEAIERRNEAWAIWRDPKQYMGDFSFVSPRQTSRQS